MIYKELASIVHPDHNPDDPSANEKMELVNKYKDNPGILRALARTWGIELSRESNSESGSNYRNSQVWDTDYLLDMQIENFLNTLIRKVLKKYKNINATYSHVIYKLKELIDKKVDEYEKSWETKKNKNRQTWNSNRRRY